MTTTIVPFGKYKGQPVEVLQQDEPYCEWLASQDWFRTKFTAIHTLIVNNFAAPHETPEHNQLQALFLDESWLQRFLCARTDLRLLYQRLQKEYAAARANRLTCLQKLQVTLAEQQARDPAATVEAAIAAAFTDGTRAGLTADQRRMYEDRWRQLQANRTIDLARYERDRVQAIEKLQGALQSCQADLTRLPEAAPPIVWRDLRTTFEERGIDVSVQAIARFTGLPRSLEAALQATGSPWGEPYTRQESVFAFCVYGSYAIECKPSLGDDYPAVLRQMRAADCDTLVIESFATVSVSFEQVAKIFAPIVILTTAQIAATEPLSTR